MGILLCPEMWAFFFLIALLHKIGTLVHGRSEKIEYPGFPPSLTEKAFNNHHYVLRDCISLSRLEGCGNEKFISPNCHSLAIHMSGKWSWKDLNVDVQVAHTNDKMGPLTTATTVTRPPYMCARGL